MAIPFHRIRIVAVLTAMFCIAGSSFTLAATKVEMANFLEEGVTLIKKKGELETELENNVAQKKAQDKEVGKYERQLEDFNSQQKNYATQCVPTHAEDLAGWCAQEYRRLKPIKESLDLRMTTINERADRLETKGQQLADQYVDIKRRFQSWELRRQLIKFRSDIQVRIDECLARQPSNTDKPEAMVLAYKICWEIAGSAPPLLIPDPPGLDDPMVVKPGPSRGKPRTADEAIKEFKDSGKPTPGRNSSKKEEPPSPDSTR